MWRGRIDQNVEWYLRKIGTYDKQLWEKSVEERLYKAIHGLHSFPKKSGKVKAELIDVDLVRGSAFTKAKPQFSWITLARKGLVRLLFSPFYRAWWSEQTSFSFWLMMQALYCLQLVAMILYCLETPPSVKNPTWRLSNVLSPFLLMLVLSILHSQIVSTQGRNNEPTSRGEKKKGSKGKRRKSRGPFSGPSELDSASPETGLEDGTKGTSLLKKAMENEKRRSDNKSGTSSNNTPPRRARSAEKAGSVERKLKRSDLNAEVEKKKIISESSPPSSSASGGDSDSDCDWFRKLSADDIGPRISQDSPETVGEIITANGDYFYDNDVIVAEANDSDDGTGTGTGDVDGVVDDIVIIGAQAASGSELVDSVSTETIVQRDSESGGSHRQDSAVEADRGLEILEDDVDDSSSRRRQGSLGVRRRRRSNLKVNIDLKGATPPRRLEKRNEVVSISSCDSDAETTCIRAPLSEAEWDRINSDLATSDTSYCMSDGSERSDDEDREISCHDDPFSWQTIGQQSNNVPTHNSHTPAHDKVSCYIWEGGECKKVDLTVLDIGWTIIRRVDKIPENAEYLVIGVFFTLLISLVPIAFRAFILRDHMTLAIITSILTSPLTLLTSPSSLNTVITSSSIDTPPCDITHTFWWGLFGYTWPTVLLTVNGIVQRCFLSFIFFFLLSVGERTFKQRCWYAKHFCHLTSSRRARKYDLPHFRLNKVRNIKTWLSLRSYLKKRGPQRSVDVIVSLAFVLAVTLVALMCVQLLKDSESFLESVFNWELTCWSLALGIYLLRFMTLGTKINKKYRNLSVLITEQINLYLHMEQKPHKKEELMLANNVLKLAEDLLKELESPFKISGLSADPFLYNVTKVVILSAFSAVLTELLGFKLKLYKIKIKT